MQFPGYSKAVAVTLADAPLSPSFVTKAFYAGGTGDLKITTRSGSIVTLKGVLAGVIYPIAANQFWATGSSASGTLNIVALGD